MNYSEYRIFSDFVAQRRIVFYYYGYFSQTIVSAMADTIKLSMKQADTSAAAKRKLFSCFVEMAQNIIHYSSAALTPATAERSRSPPGLGLHRPHRRPLLPDVLESRYGRRRRRPCAKKRSNRSEQ